MRVIERVIVILFGAPPSAEATWPGGTPVGAGAPWPAGVPTGALEPGVMTRALLSILTASDGERPGRTTKDECLYVGEAGRVMTRRELLESMPPPAGKPRR
jgi:hypothetical protein